MQKVFVANKALLVNPAGRVLVIREAKRGRWEFPGGRLEKDESLAEGLIREVMEETGISIDGKKSRLFFSDMLHLRGDPKRPLIRMCYIIPIAGTAVQLTPEHDAFEWIDPHHQLSSEIDACIGHIIDAYRATEGMLVMKKPQGKQSPTFGKIQLFTGNGKGKTTAALGEAMRCAALGKKVGIVFFDKGGNSHYSERKLLETLPTVTFEATGRDRIDPITNGFDFSLNTLDREEVQRGLKVAKQFCDDKVDLLILDEINSCTALGLVDAEDVLRFLDEKPPNVEVILTGRNAPTVFLERADLVTEMKLRKHYFYEGLEAREGLDF